MGRKHEGRWHGVVVGSRGKVPPREVGEMWGEGGLGVKCKLLASQLDSVLPSLWLFRGRESGFMCGTRKTWS